MREKNEVLTTYVGDMHALVTHGVQAIKRQVANLEGDQGKGHPQALEAVRDFHRSLESQASSLEARLNGIGGSATKPVKDAVAAVAGLAAGLINAVRAEEASKSIRDDYTFLSHVAIGYLMLNTTAMSLGDQETAALAQRSYQDTARMIIHIDRIMPALVVQELRQDGLPVSDISQEIRSLVHQAWKRES